jgi:hypothetical protein
LLISVTPLRRFEAHSCGGANPEARTLAIELLDETPEQFLIRNGAEFESRLLRGARPTEQLRMRERAPGLELDRKSAAPIRIASFEV